MKLGRCSAHDSCVAGAGLYTAESAPGFTCPSCGAPLEEVELPPPEAGSIRINKETDDPLDAEAGADSTATPQGVDGVSSRAGLAEEHSAEDLAKKLKPGKKKALRRLLAFVVITVLIAAGGIAAYEHYGLDGIDELRTSASGFLPWAAAGGVEARPGIGPREREAALAWLKQEASSALPAGYRPAGSPVSLASPADAGWLDFELPVRVSEPIYAVRGAKLTFSESRSRDLASMAEDLSVGSRFGEGMMYDIPRAEEVEDTEDYMVAIRVAPQGQSWSVRSADLSGKRAAYREEGAAAVVSEILVTASEFETLRERQAETIGRIEGLWLDTEKRIAAAENEVAGSFASPCDTAPLIREIVSETSRCQRLNDGNERAHCLANIDRLNVRLGTCEEQQARHSRARSGVADQLKSIREEHVWDFKAAVKELTEAPQDDGQTEAYEYNQGDI